MMSSRNRNQYVKWFINHESRRYLRVIFPLQHVNGYDCHIFYTSGAQCEVNGVTYEKSYTFQLLGQCAQATCQENGEVTTLGQENLDDPFPLCCVTAVTKETGKIRGSQEKCVLCDKLTVAMGTAEKSASQGTKIALLSAYIPANIRSTSY
ncbi:hypothetical protein J6590_050732 [Homalodisca vitripennis]|nr:hypothetical protein J6590_050732 [Homalodisca vitripennis]